MTPVELENKYGAHNYHPLPVMITLGEGIYVWDENNKRYMDMMSAYSAISHGHCHPRLVEVLTHQAKTVAVVSRAFYSETLGKFLQKACELTGMPRALPMNSGAEAVETALKAARKWAYKVKKVPENKAEVIACTNNFHGRTISIVSMSTEAQYREGFGPFPTGFKIVQYGDAQALEKEITPNTAAFILEPIQGEAGIIVPPMGYLKACEEICRKHNVLLITDEIQTGLGRTGKLLASQHENVKPDCITLGKALGGGLMPVSLFLAREDVMDVFTPGDHGSTFGGSPLAAAVGYEALNVLVEEDLIEHAHKIGEYFMSELKKIKSPLIKDVRGKGLLIGIEIDTQKKAAREICLELLKLGLLSKETHHTVIRLAPPLIITKEQIDEAMGIIKSVIK
ncbi:MAG: ornithine--oxo-acid transaminase [Gammaproteobacteria bacterium]|nr:ornithine--oxo-acid transaminase [Gammaproteobacteria bacterium]